MEALTMNQPADHPTLLNMPTWCWREPSTVILPRPAADYELREVQPDWFEVRERDSANLIWSGIGPVSVTVSPAPF